jgi:two-component system sensor histidine kinase UhpB
MLLQNIMLVENHLGDAQRIQRMLRGISEKIIHTRTLEAACQVIRGRSHRTSVDGGIDIVLMDLWLPDAVGLEGVRLLRHLAPHIPCIVMTGALEQDAGPTALQEGAEDFISKTELKPNLLARAIGYAIERNKRLQASREAEAGLRRIVEAHPDAMLVVGADDLIKLANPAAAALLGRSARQLVGSHPPFPLAEGTPTILELTGLLGGRTVEIVTSRTSWKGESAWLAAVRDVSYRKREERLRRQLEHTERLAVLGQFFAEPLP